MASFHIIIQGTSVNADILRLPGDVQADFIITNARRMRNPFQTIENSDKEKCMLSCVNNFACVSFNVDWNSGKCELIDRHFDEKESDVDYTHGWWNYDTPVRVDGQWSTWSSSSICSVSCNGGEKTRHRTCDSPEPRFGGLPCLTTPTGGERLMIQHQKAACEEKKCSVDGHWSTWGQWTVCSVTCGHGERNRTRRCDNPVPAKGGLECKGNDIEVEVCNNRSCPVNGQWTTWGGHSKCSVTCGGGTTERNRTCSNPLPAHGGSHCNGSTNETLTCNNEKCPVNGEWTTWRNYGRCSVTCGRGTKEKNRTCSNPSPAFGGSHCNGSRNETITCNNEPCPVNGEWSVWGDYSACSVTCGGGTKGRNRTCTNPSPTYGGLNCSGSRNETITCNNVPCSDICALKNVYYYGNTLGTSKKAASWEKCRRRCQETIACFAWSYRTRKYVDPSAQKSCELKKMTSKQDIKTFFDTLSGLKNCIEICPLMDVVYQDNLVRSVKDIASWKDCRQSCQDAINCFAWTYYNNNYSFEDARKTCQLKNYKYHENKRSESHTISGAKNCTAISD